eukprot:44772-Ditylum_brightwellii.AAC.1
MHSFTKEIQTKDKGGIQESTLEVAESVVKDKTKCYTQNIEDLKRAMIAEHDEVKRIMIAERNESTQLRYIVTFLIGMIAGGAFVANRQR